MQNPKLERYEMNLRPLKNGSKWSGFAFLFVFSGSTFVQAVQTDKPIVWKADFVAGEDAGTLITENAAFKNRIRKALAAETVSFFSSPLNAEQTLHSLTRADLFYFSGHTIGNLDPPMQAIQVRGSDRGRPGKLTAVDIRKHLVAHATGPRLVILVGCQTMNLNDGVPPAFRLNSAFGIQRESRGRAFLGYETPIVGAMADDTMSKLIEYWTQPNENGVWPTIEEAVKFVQSPIKIVGDSNLRYRGRLGFRKGDSQMLDFRFQDEQDTKETVLDDGLPGKPDDFPAKYLVVKWSTYPRLEADGLNYFECVISREDDVAQAKRNFDARVSEMRESAQSFKKGRANMKDDVRDLFDEDTCALGISTTTSDGTPIHSSDESITLYRNRFLIKTKRGKDHLVADFSSERLTLLERAKALIDARWPAGTD